MGRYRPKSLRIGSVAPSSDSLVHTAHMHLESQKRQERFRIVQAAPNDVAVAPLAQVSRKPPDMSRDPNVVREWRPEPGPRWRGGWPGIESLPPSAFHPDKPITDGENERSDAAPDAPIDD